MLDHHEVLRHELRSVLDAGAPWTNFSWGFQVLIAAAYELGGEWGLVGLKLLMWLGVVIGIGSTVPTERPWQLLGWAVVLLLAAFTLPAYMMLRPHLLAGLCLVLTLVLMRRPLGARVIALWVVVLLMWANVHASVVVGCAAFGFHALGEWLRVGYSKTTLIKRSVLLVPIALIPFLTPNGVDVIHVLLDHATGDLARSYILEWWGAVILPPLALLGVLALIGFATETRRFSFGEFFLFAFFTYFALESHRFQFELTVMAMRPGAIGLSRLLDGLGQDKIRFRVATVLVLAAIAGAATYGAGFRAERLWSGVPVALGVYPSSSAHVLVDVAEKLGRPVRALNHYEFGGYLQWMGDGKIRTFIDGRTPTIFSDERLMMDVFAISRRDMRRRLADLYDIDAIVLRRGSGLGFPLEDKQWKLVAFDSASYLYMRASAAAKLGYAPVDFDPAVLKAMPEGVAQRLKIVNFLVAIDPSNFVAWMQLGLNLSLLNDRQSDAINAYETAIQVRPRSALARLLLGELLSANGTNDQDVYQVLAPVVAVAPDELSVHRLQQLSALLLKIHRPSSALTVLAATNPEKKYRLDTHYSTWLHRGIAHVAEGDISKAEFALSMASMLVRSDDPEGAVSVQALRTLLDSEGGKRN